MPSNSRLAAAQESCIEELGARGLSEARIATGALPDVTGVVVVTFTALPA